MTLIEQLRARQARRAVELAERAAAARTQRKAEAEKVVDEAHPPVPPGFEGFFDARRR